MSANPNIDQHTLIRRATYASVTAAVFLILIKLFAFLATNSIALLATLVDSLLDAGASLINLFAVRHALTPADEEHRFGHGKAEALAGLGQAAFIAGSAIFLFLEAISRLINPHVVEASAIGVSVMLISIVTTLTLVSYQQRVIKQTQSVAISADSLHYKGDLLVNVAVIIALILATQFALPKADPILCLLIAIYILYNAWQIVKQSVDHLMDRELPDEMRTQIAQVAANHPDVFGFHDLRTRQSGPDLFIQLHLELDADLSLSEAHRISADVQAKILTLFPNADVIVHEDAKEKPALQKV